MRRTLVVGLLLFAVTAGVAAAQGKPLYRSDATAEHYLEHGLRLWAGINLRKASFVDAFCVNGYYSKHEQRTGKHFPQGRESKAGENLFRSFSCTLTVGEHSYNLYLVTTRTRTGWRIRADR